eukprot:CAMPEP_0184501062 /NCGR_PEP_ID=MMETSP0113_2-20130426/46606_1 /TAXON_ID=91329 /ORGANISM="Norrisiella sphaerica, Strain BC52" /LENGTH=427 /DNA_ID=CAMNT_0026889699 /DNA_START=202 /DNA_END=1485 /DNA_ORIENTATION=+
MAQGTTTLESTASAVSSIGGTALNSYFTTFGHNNFYVLTGLGLIILAITGLLLKHFRGMEASARLTLFVCVPGIVIPLIAYSYEQERVMQTPYILEAEQTKEFFLKSWIPILVMFNRFGASLFAVVMLLWNGESMGRRAPMANYFAVSISNVIATLCQYMALKYISFAMQSLSKCSKIIWVMVWGYIMSGKKYNWDEYTTAFIVTAGAFMFGLAGDIETGYDAEMGVSSTTGILLMVGYHIADGLTSTLQEKIFRGYRLTHYNQMLYVNLFSGFLAMSLVLAKGNIMPEFISFVQRHPACVYDIGMLVASQITAQNFIYMMIKNFGALLLATIMYSRQLLSIVFNTMWFGDPVTPLQWVSVVIVFGALFSRSEFVRRLFLNKVRKIRKAQPVRDDLEMDMVNPLPKTDMDKSIKRQPSANSIAKVED